MDISIFTLFYLYLGGSPFHCKTLVSHYSSHSLLCIESNDKLLGLFLGLFSKS